MSREVPTSGTAKHKGQARRACKIWMVWEQMQNGLCVVEDTLFQIYQLVIKKKVAQQFLLCIKLLEKPHPRETALHPLNRAKPSAEQRNILFLFTYVQLST